VSGDVVGALLVDAIRADSPGNTVLGIGGPRMAAAGARIVFKTSHLGTVGLAEALATAPGFWHAFKALRQLVREHNPDVAVLIGNDVFNLVAARWLRAQGVPTVSLFPPQVWIWRSLARFVVNSFDVVLTSFPEEQREYGRVRTSTHVAFVGHYLADLLQQRTATTIADARSRIGLPDAGRVITLMPGSRGHEIHELLPPLAAAAARLSSEHPHTHFLVPVAEATHRAFIEDTLRAYGPDIRVTILDGSSHDAMTAADVLLVASGTATLEAALLGVPMIILYRGSRFTFAVGRALVRLGVLRSTTVGLPNLILGKRVVPELLQLAVTPEAIASAADKLLGSPQHQRDMVTALAEAGRRVATGEALKRAAQTVLERGRAHQSLSLPHRGSASKGSKGGKMGCPRDSILITEDEA